MCGILGIASHSSVTLDVLLDALERLEYRGYDSAGVAYLDDGLSVTKQSGDIARLRETLSTVDDRFRFGIAYPIARSKLIRQTARTDLNFSHHR